MGLGIDLQLSKFVIYGIMLGVSKEAACIAAALSMERLPFRIATSFFHDGEEMNHIITTTLLSQNEFDDGNYSIPIMMLRLLIWAREKHRTNDELAYYGLVRSRLNVFLKTSSHLESRVMKFDKLAADIRDPSKNKYVANAIRLALTWAFRTQIVKMRSKSSGPNTSLSNETSFRIKGSKELSNSHIVNILQGNFEGTFSIHGNTLEKFMIMYNTEDITKLQEDTVIAFESLHSNISGLKMCMLRDSNKGNAYVCRAWVDSGDPAAIRFKRLLCDVFCIPEGSAIGTTADGKFYVFSSQSSPKEKKSLYRLLRELCPSFSEIRILNATRKYVVCDVNLKTNLEISREYISALFPSSENISSSTIRRKKTLVFDSTASNHINSQSQNVPLICDLPLPARILKNIQFRSDRRREYAITVRKNISNSGTDEEDEVVQFQLKGDCNAEWSYESSGWDENIIAQESSPMIGRESLMSVALHHSTLPVYVYGVCSSALVVGRNMDMVVVDNITLLPPGSEWVQKAMLCVESENMIPKPDGEYMLSPNEEATASLIGWVLEQNLGHVPPRALEDHIYNLFATFVGEKDVQVQNSSVPSRPSKTLSGLVPAAVVKRIPAKPKIPPSQAERNISEVPTKLNVLNKKIIDAKKDIQAMETELLKKRNLLQELESTQRVLTRSHITQQMFQTSSGTTTEEVDTSDNEEEIILLGAT